MNSTRFMEMAYEEGITEEQDLLAAMDDYRQQYGAFEDDGEVAPPPSDKPDYILPEEERVWTAAGGTLPDPKKLLEYYGRGIKSLIEDPFKTLFPIAEAIGKPDDPEALRLAKTNVGGLMDVLTSLDRGIDFITGGLFKEGKAAGKQAIPGSNIISETARNLFDIGTDPSTLIGVGPVKKMIEKPVEASIKEAAKQVGTSLPKKAVAQITKLDQKLLQRAADDPDYLKRLQEAAVEAEVGGFDELVDNVKQKINSINIETKVAARKKMDDLNRFLDVTTETSNDIMTDKIKNTIGIDIDNISPAIKGVDIQEAVKKSKEQIGDIFGKKQAEYLDESMVLTKSQTGSSPLSESVGKILGEAGYDGKTYRAVEKFDNSPALKSDISDAVSIMELGEYAETISDAVNQLRTVRKLKGTPKPDGSFYNSVMIGKIDNAYQEVIKDNLSKYDERFGEMWGINNSRYKEAITTLQNVNKGLKIDKTGAENYINKIKDLGFENLIDMKKTASIDENIAPVWKLLQEGFTDDFVVRSLDKNGTLDIDKLMQNWNNVDVDVKEVILGKDKATAISEALALFQANQKAIKSQKESIKNQISRISKMEGSIGKNLASRTAYSRLRNIGSHTKVAVEAKETLKILDEFYGTDFVSKADDFWNARQLKISSEGEIPWLPTDTTGRSLLGIAITKSLGLFERIPIAGNLISTAIGLTGQSPAGAVAIFRTLNSIARAKNATLKSGPTLIGGTLLSSRTAMKDLPSRQQTSQY